MRVLVTGANGFIGRNLCVRLAARDGVTIETLVRGDGDLAAKVAAADAIIHLAGANRPPDPQGFADDNTGLTENLAAAVRADTGHRKLIVFASSTQAALENPYGASKRLAEDMLAGLADDGIADVALLRLPNVFGKWARPHYNSAVATFCDAAAHDRPLPVNDASAPLRLVYIDDVVGCMLALLDSRPPGLTGPEAAPVYTTTVGEVASLIGGFAAMRPALGVGQVGHGLARALYATYLSALSPADFSYRIPAYGDPRGRFVEAVKTRDSGQMSYFTQSPGEVRGGHYHHSKSEKFLVVSGRARFRFRQLVTAERHAIEVDAAVPTIVDTIPGWAHDVVNLGDGELVVLVWANEVFDRAHPDTITAEVEPCAV